MNVCSEEGREALYIGCVYMPTDSTSISVMDSCYERLRNVLIFRERGKVVLLGDFNVRFGTWLVCLRGIHAMLYIVEINYFPFFE